ncbi:hypothetical protein B0H16DRAFT_1230806, partial [Mycena metata]
VRRPSNSFFCFRSSLAREDKLCGSAMDQRDLSKVAGQLWATLPRHERLPFILEAKERRKEFYRMNPDYQYT